MSIASSHVMVPESGQTFSAHSILGMSLIYDAASDSGKNSDQELKVRIRSSVSAFVHCYYRSGDARINRILPSVGYAHTYFAAGQTLTVPVDRRLARVSDLTNEVAFLCLAAEEELVDRLPLELTVSDTRTSFHNMNFSRIFSLYRHSTERNLVARSIGWNTSL
ncbi:MAG: hypothetical protein AB8B63_18860 [Granulosicoccus sp.]